MTQLDYIVIILYFIGLIAVSLLMSKRINNSEDMFIAGRNSSWWLSGLSTYMTIFSASTFVIWGGVAYRSGLVATVVGMTLGFACLLTGKYLCGKWREMRIKSPGEFLVVRFGGKTIDFYTITGIIGRGVHTAVALYAIAVVVCALMVLPEGHFLADSTGHLSVAWAVAILGVITLFYTMTGGFLAVLMTDMIQFGVLLTMVVFMLPLSLDAVGGVSGLKDAAPAGYFNLFSDDYTMFWMVLWFFVNVFTIGGDWPFVQRYLSNPTRKDARKSNYLVGVLYFITPIIWYIPAMCYRVINPDANPEQAYILMSQHVLMNGMLGVMIAAMISATLSCVSGTLNVFANVFTYDIYCKKHPETPDKKRIYIGRLFTMIYGLSILIIGLIIPYAGGAEKVVVTILTMVIGPLYIPSVWGVFSKRITARQVISTMLITYIVGFAAKYFLSDMMNPKVLESSIGVLLPVALLLIFEYYDKLKGRVDPGYDRIQALVDPDCDIVASPEMKKAVKSYSFMAINCFLATLGGIAILLCILLMTEEFEDSVARIMEGTIYIIFGLCALYCGYRWLDKVRSARKELETD